MVERMGRERRCGSPDEGCLCSRDIAACRAVAPDRFDADRVIVIITHITILVFIVLIIIIVKQRRERRAKKEWDSLHLLLISLKFLGSCQGGLQVIRSSLTCTSTLYIILGS